jgi:hypothetical protein
MAKEDTASILHVLSYVNDAVQLFEDAKSSAHSKLPLSEWKFLLLVDKELRMLQSKLEDAVLRN